MTCVWVSEASTGCRRDAPAEPAATLGASQAKSIVFLFNTVEALQPLRDAVGGGRCEIGFPTGFSLLVDGKLRVSFSGPGQNVTVSSRAWAE